MITRWISLWGALAAAPGPRQVPAAPISIAGQLAGCPDSATVAVFEPVPGGQLNYFFADMPNEAVVRGGRFRYQLRHAPTGIVLLTGKCLPQGWVFVEPGAQVTFAQAKTAQGKLLFRFGGANAAANDLLANRRLLNDGPLDGDRVGRLLGAAPTAAAVLTKLQALLQVSLDQLAALRRQRQISGPCHDYLRAETEQRLLFWSASLLAAHFTDSAKTNLRLAMSRAETRQLAQLLFARYDPDLPRYTFTTLRNSAAKADFVRRAILPGAAPTTRLWAGFSAQFAPIASNFELYDYAPLAVQEQQVGDLLLTAQALSALSPADLTAATAAYQQRFPASPYGPVLARTLAKTAPKPAPKTALKTDSEAAPTAQNRIFGRYIAGAAALAFAPAPGLDTVRTLGGLVRAQRPGRAVFVDLWASWCGPCIQEFAHEPELHKFLADHDIDIVYVALDQPGFQPKWAVLAARYRLQGYHYLAPPALQKALAGSVASIPRYMLFDKSGALVEANAYHPSDGEKLRRQLRKRLGHPTP